MKLSAPIFRLKRQAKLLARTERIQLAAALDRIARQEGYAAWSHLAHRQTANDPAQNILNALTPGDLVLLGARPGHGKTTLGLQLVLNAVSSGRTGCFFTLEMLNRDVLHTLRSLGADPDRVASSLVIDTSDDINADHIISIVRAAPSNALAVVDYLQLLDQKRSNPDLDTQVSALRNFARTSGQTIVLTSQIDRIFEAEGRSMPGLSDVRLPNPLDLSLFTKTCFLHEGEIEISKAA
ncbi:DNA helicase [Roseibium algae]|uniref:DNA helicase n=1 Tax=Roseibium algae TaxID=3123038 RepID=A0ABU8TK77_9HYPH